MTERLYYLDAYQTEFEGTVMACEQDGDRWRIILDRTLFFPEGGGQWPDLGTLGTVNVLDVHEKGNDVLHYTDGPLTVGMKVAGRIDWDRRLSVMQQHSGEHIFTGLVHGTYGYDNVGFHIGSEAVTVDFNGVLSEAQVYEIEKQANQIIAQDLPIEAFIADEEQRRTLPYRSKKEIDGDLRIVRVEGVDLCACCGTHLRTTGAVGQIKVLGVQKYKSGVRISLLCGLRALEYENKVQAELRKICLMLSSKEDTSAQSVEHLLEERKQLRYEKEQIGMKMFSLLAQQEAQNSVRVVYCEALSPEMTAKAAGQLAEGAELAAVMSGYDPYNFAICSSKKDVRPLTRAFCMAFEGKGGGRPDMTQGKMKGTDEETVRSWLSTYRE